MEPRCRMVLTNFMSTRYVVVLPLTGQLYAAAADVSVSKCFSDVFVFPKGQEALNQPPPPSSQGLATKGVDRAF